MASPSDRCAARRWHRLGEAGVEEGQAEAKKAAEEIKKQIEEASK